MEPRRTGKHRRAFLTDADHKHVFHFTPKHGSWLNQVELWFGTLARRFLKRGDFASAQEFVARLTVYLEDHNAHRAHPYRWTYTGQPLVRATPFSQTRRQQRFGRAWFGSRPQRFDRFLYPLRPYRRHPTDKLLKDLKNGRLVYESGHGKSTRRLFLDRSFHPELDQNRLVFFAFRSSPTP